MEDWVNPRYSRPIRELARMIYDDKYVLNIFTKRWSDPNYEFTDIEEEIIQLIIEIES